MEYDAVIGNPSYQEEGEGTRQAPVYNLFYDLAFAVSKLATLITPGRFLFRAGQTPKPWIDKMLSDDHFKVVRYINNPKDVFPSVEIKGGVAITLRNEDECFGAIKVFTPYPELLRIAEKVRRYTAPGDFLNSIIASQGLFRFSESFFAEHPAAKALIGEGTGAKIVSNIMEKLPYVFMDKPIAGRSCIKMLGRMSQKRAYKYIDSRYVIGNDYIGSYKLFIPEANGNGVFGERLTEPTIGYPNEGSADTFLNGGLFSSVEEPMNFLRYFRTRFFRALLGLRKATHHCPPSVWEMIPVQDFTAASDIDWSQDIADIDQQLYKKYGFTDEEIRFVEINVQPMQ